MQKRMPHGYSQLVRVSHFFLRNLPLRTASALFARIFTRYGDRFLKMHCIRKNLRDAFPQLEDHEVEDLTAKIAANFGRQIAEMAHARSFLARANGALLETDCGQGRSLGDFGPAIYVGAHVGSWELAPLAFERLGVPLAVVYSKDKNPITENAVQALRKNIGSRYIDKSKGAKHTMAALAQGSSVALLVDQRVASGFEVDFFGRRTIMTRLPARLASKFGCPIIPFEVVRDGPGQLRIIFRDPIIPSGDVGEHAEVALTQRMALDIQASIERNKETWFCNTRRWKERDILTTSSERKVRLAPPDRSAKSTTVQKISAVRRQKTNSPSKQTSV